jgi:transcriptional regulator with XRE-family HTH domain
VLPDLPSSAARRALAVELRRLRERLGWSGDDVALRLGWSGSKVSRIETHRTGIKRDDLELLLSLYDLDDAQRGQLRALADEQEARGWWNAYTSTFLPTYIAYIGLEAAASTIRCWSPELIHGLLQTEDYARAATTIASGSPPLVSPGEIDRRIEARLRRQELLAQPGPQEFFFILDEAALRHRFGTSAIMRGQLIHIEELSHHPHITIQVLAFAGSYPIGPGGFALLQFDPVHGTRLNDVVYMEHLTSNSFVEAETEAYEYDLAFRRLTTAALDEAESRKLLLKVAKDVWS